MIISMIPIGLLESSLESKFSFVDLCKVGGGSVLEHSYNAMLCNKDNVEFVLANHLNGF